MKFPSDNDPSGEVSKDELAELQRMVSENEKALSRARQMIDELKGHLKPEARKTRGSRTRKKS